LVDTELDDPRKMGNQDFASTISKDIKTQMMFEFLFE
jgi:hypothetical protein